MSVSAATVLSAMLALAPSYLDKSETLEQRTELYRPVAEAIAEVARNESEAALLIADGHHESGFARAVLEYRCQDIGRLACDRNRARGFAQVHSWCRGNGPVAEALCALRIIRDGKERCRDSALTPMHGAFSALAARHCGWAGADVRVRTFKRVLAQLRRHS
jgi:hypothetical protein